MVAQPGLAQFITIVHGTEEWAIPPLLNRVSTIRSRFKAVANISREAVACIDGRPVPEDTLVHPGETVAFVNLWGRKGGWDETDSRIHNSDRDPRFVELRDRILAGEIAERVLAEPRVIEAGLTNNARLMLEGLGRENERMSVGEIIDSGLSAVFDRAWWS